MKAALLIINFQNDYFENGALKIDNASETIPIINEIRTKYDNKFSSIFIISDNRTETHISFNTSPYAKEENLPFDNITLSSKGKFPPNCIEGTNGAALNPEMILKGNEIRIKKNEDKFKDEMSCFNVKMIRDIIQTDQINTIFLCGFTLEFSVGMTAIEGEKMGLDTYIISECTKSFNKNSEQSMLKNLNAKNIKLINYEKFKEIIGGIPDIKKE